jgi:hypothetical protein
MILGLNVIASLASILSLFLNMSWLAQLLLLAGALVIAPLTLVEIKASFGRGFARKHWIDWLLVMMAATVILYAVKVPGNGDTLLYHAQAIHWAEEFPVVPGLGNLDPRLGAGSNWFVVNALFSLSFLKLQSFHLLPSFLFLVCLSYFEGGLQSFLAGDFRLSQIVKAGLIPFAFWVLIGEVSSPGTDLPVILLYWVILCFWAELLEGIYQSSLPRMVLFILALSVVTYKLSGALIALIGFWILIDLWRQKEYRQVWTCLGMGAVIGLPWLARNFVLSGYWVFPEPLVSAFSPAVDWKVPMYRLLAFKLGTQAYAFTPGFGWDHLASLSPLGRLAVWFAGLTLNQKGLFLLALVSPIVFWLFVPPYRSIKKVWTSPHSIVILIAFVNLLFWLLTAPNFRFGYGFLIGTLVLALASFALFLLEKLRTYGRYLVIALLFIFTLQQVQLILQAGRDGTQHGNYLVLPARYPRVPTNECSLGEHVILCARKWELCGYDAFPCSRKPPENIELRGSTLRDGFHSTVHQDP